MYWSHFHSVVGIIEESTSAEGTKYWIYTVVTHIVGGDRW